MMQDIIKTIEPELMILIPFGYGICYIMKSIKIFPDRFIPAVSCLIVILMAILYNINKKSTSFMFSAISQGVIAWLVAWLTYSKFMLDKEQIDVDNKKEEEIKKETIETEETK